MSDLGNKKIFSKNLQRYMYANNIDRSEICKALDFKYSTFAEWFNGTAYPRIDKIEKLASFFGIQKSDLIEDKNNTLTINSKAIRIPVLGSIPAGIPFEMIEDIVDYEDISEDMLKGGKQYFALKIKGDSMFPEYLNGDVIIVLKQDNCESGQDCVVAVNGDDATFKRVFKYDNGITLQPLNNAYMPLFYSNEDIVNKPVKILGVVKQIRRDK